MTLGGKTRMKTIIQDARWEGTDLHRYEARSKNFTNASFQELVVRNATVQDCSFDRCEFKNCYLGFNVQYNGCSWSKCNFHGKYSALGGPSLFEDCRFEDIRMQSESTDECTFRRCILAGKLRNMIWRGTATPRNVVFEHCDLSGAVFENISVYGGVDLSTVILPRTGVRVFNNAGGAFSRALRESAGSLEKDAGIPLDVLGNADCYDEQNPVVFDVVVLADFLGSDVIRNAFETVAREYEVTQPSSACDSQPCGFRTHER